MVSWEEFHKGLTVSEPHFKFVDFADKQLKPGMRVLDLGCGKGRHSLYCARKGMDTYAVDSAGNALEVLRKASEEEGLSIRISKSNIREMPYEDLFFDAIVSVNVLNHGHRKDIKDYFAESFRVLKKGGLFYIIGLPLDFLKDVKGPDTKEIEKGTFLGLNTLDSDVPHHLFSRDEIGELLKDYEILSMENFRERSQWLDKDVTHLEVIARKK